MKTIIFDWKRTLYDPDSRELIDGALDILNFLKNKSVRLALVGKGAQDMHDEVERLGVKNHFEHVNFREGSKDASLFKTFIDKRSPEDTLFIGDRVKSELAVGNSLGATTIWIRQGKFADDVPDGPAEQPNYTFASLKELRTFLEKAL